MPTRARLPHCATRAAHGGRRRPRALLLYATWRRERRGESAARVGRRRLLYRPQRTASADVSLTSARAFLVRAGPGCMPAPPALQRPAEQAGQGSASAAQLLLFAAASLLLARLLARFIASYLRRVAPPPAAMAAPPPEPVMCGELTLDELRAFDGSDPSKPLYLVRRPGLRHAARAVPPWRVARRCSRVVRALRAAAGAD